MSPAPVKRPAMSPAPVKRPAMSPAPVKRPAMSTAPLTNHNCCIARITLLPVADRQHADLVLLPGKSLGELAGLGHGCLLQPAAAGVSQGGAVPDEEALLLAGCRCFPSNRYDLVILSHRHVHHGKRFWAKTKSVCYISPPGCHGLACHHYNLVTLHHCHVHHHGKRFWRNRQASVCVDATVNSLSSHLCTMCRDQTRQSRRFLLLL